MIPTPVRRSLGAFGVLLLTAPLPSCIFTDGPHFGGFGSIASDPLGALESEPPDLRPNPHMDPVIVRRSALSLSWDEDLTKSSNNTEPDPDELRNR